MTDPKPTTRDQRIEPSMTVRCPKCGGDGKRPDETGERVLRCGRCHGAGEIPSRHAMAVGLYG